MIGPMFRWATTCLSYVAPTSPRGLGPNRGELSEGTKPESERDAEITVALHTTLRPWPIVNGGLLSVLSIAA